MARTPQNSDGHGSLRDLQILVNDRPNLLDATIEESRSVRSSAITWVSPRKDNEFAEYSDDDFLERVGLGEHAGAFRDFWPTGGPQWDGLGIGDHSEVFLVEAKANVPEIFSDGSGASEPSLDLIRRSLESCRAGLKAKARLDWTGCFYQYANRLAHLWWLREKQKVPAFLVLVYFMNDDTVSRSPRTCEEWKTALYVMKRTMGVSEHRLQKYVVEAFIDVVDLEA